MSKEERKGAVTYGWWLGRIDQMSEDLAYIEECQDYLFDLIKETKDFGEQKMYMSKMFQVDNMRYKMSEAFQNTLSKVKAKYPKFEYTDGEPCVMATLVKLEGNKVMMKDRRKVVATIKEHLGDKANRGGYIKGNSNG